MNEETRPESGCENTEWTVKSKFTRSVTKEESTKDEWGQVMIVLFIQWCQDKKIDLTAGEKLDRDGAAQLYFEFLHDIYK